MNKEKLIEEIKKYPFLYDSCDVKYNDTMKRDQAWKNIASVLSASESDCKKKWLNLRESHRRAIKKKETKTGQPAPSTKKWQFEEEMSFILPHLRHRSSLSSDKEQSYNNYDDEFIDDVLVSELNKNDLLTSTNHSQEDNRLHPVSSTSKHNSNTHFFSNICKTKKRQRKGEGNYATAEVVKYLLNEKKIRENDEIEKFFSSIATTVKKLTTYNQAILKTKIFNLVSEVEIKEIQQSSRYYYDTATNEAADYNNHVSNDEIAGSSSFVKEETQSCAVDIDLQEDDY